METITVPEALPMRINRDALVDICRRYHVRELAVFGSVLRDDFGPASDVDVLVDLAPTTPIKSLLDRAQLVVELESVFGRTVDLADKQRLYPRLAREILATREVMYAATE
jgi:predicted nucleotidyltransferase